jgi:hypothetical protein
MHSKSVWTERAFWKYLHDWDLAIEKASELGFSVTVDRQPIA